MSDSQIPFAVGNSTTHPGHATSPFETTWVTALMAGFLAFSTLIGSDAFENYCASGAILWPAGFLYLSPVGSIGVFKAGIKMIYGPERSKRLGWEPQDVLFNKEKLYNFARHATPGYVVNKAETHYRRLYTWRPGSGPNPIVRVSPGSSGSSVSEIPPDTNVPHSRFRLTGGYCIKTRVKQRDDDIWMMGGRCLAINELTVNAHNWALNANATTSIVVSLLLAMISGAYESISIAFHGWEFPSTVGIVWTVTGPALHAWLTLLSAHRLRLRKLADGGSDAWYGVSLAEQRKWRYFRTSMNVYGIKGGVMQMRPQDYRVQTFWIGILLVLYSVLSIIYQAVLSARISNNALNAWLRSVMTVYLVLGLVARFSVFSAYLRWWERGPKRSNIDHPDLAAQILFECLVGPAGSNGSDKDKKKRIINQLACWLAATSIQDITVLTTGKTEIRFRLAHVQGERWNFVHEGGEQSPEMTENLATVTVADGSFRLRLPRCGYADSAVSKILFGRNMASVFMYKGKSETVMGTLFVREVPKKNKQSSESQQHRYFFGNLRKTPEEDHIWVVPGRSASEDCSWKEDRPRTTWSGLSCVRSLRGKSFDTLTGGQNQPDRSEDAISDLGQEHPEALKLKLDPGMEMKKLVNKITGTSTEVALEAKTTPAPNIESASSEDKGKDRQQSGSPDNQSGTNAPAITKQEDELDETATLTSICYSDLPAQDRKRADFLDRFEGLRHQTLHRVVATVSAMSGWYDFSKLEQIDGAAGGNTHITGSQSEPSGGWLEYQTPCTFEHAAVRNSPSQVAPVTTGSGGGPT